MTTFRCNPAAAPSLIWCSSPPASRPQSSKFLGSLASSCTANCCQQHPCLALSCVQKRGINVSATFALARSVLQACPFPVRSVVQSLLAIPLCSNSSGAPAGEFASRKSSHPRTPTCCILNMRPAFSSKVPVGSFIAWVSLGLQQSQTSYLVS